MEIAALHLADQPMNSARTKLIRMMRGHFFQEIECFDQIVSLPLAPLGASSGKAPKRSSRDLFCLAIPRKTRSIVLPNGATLGASRVYFFFFFFFFFFFLKKKKKKKKKIYQFSGISQQDLAVTRRVLEKLYDRLRPS